MARHNFWTLSGLFSFASRHCSTENDIAKNFDITGYAFVHKQPKYNQSFYPPNGQPSRGALPHIAVLYIMNSCAKLL